jgi:2-iminobutanoate/2-iminopropanoate deaminase
MNEIILTKNAPQAIGPYSQAIESGGFLFISGQIALSPETGELNMETIKIETHQVMKNLEAILLAAGLDFSYVIKSSIFLKNMDDFSVVNKIYGNYFKNKTYPVRETLAVAGLPKNVNVEISMIAKM